MKKVFIDCSYIVDHVELNTGIQRVVRRVVESLDEIASANEVEIIPVSIVGGSFQALSHDRLYPQTTEAQATNGKVRLVDKAKRYLRDVYVSGRSFIDALCGHQRVIQHFLYAPRTQFGLSACMYAPVNLMKVVMQRGEQKKKQRAQLAMFDTISEGDVLLLLDSTWYADIWPSVRRAKSKGASVVSIIYDLIPITHSNFCDDFLVDVFRNYFKTSIDYIDRYIAISHTVQKDLESFMGANFADAVKEKEFDYFLLGSDFEAKAEVKSVRDDLITCFQSRPSYLIVSTVEPRKNHQYLLDAFDILWDQGLDVNLCIVGRVGWKVESLIERINGHPQYGEKLFHFADINDEQLSYCYQSAKMLVFPSIVEGFGLPIVESLNYGLPVLASKTPVHQEVGGNRIGYFNLAAPDSLANMVTNIELNGMPAEYQVPAGYKWMTWQESSLMLLSKIK